MAESCEHGSETSGLMKSEEFFNHLNEGNYLLELVTHTHTFLRLFFFISGSFHEMYFPVFWQHEWKKSSA